MYYSYEEVGEQIEVAVVHLILIVIQRSFNITQELREQNTKTYIPPAKQVDRMIQLTEEVITPNTKYIFWPETSISNNIDEKNSRKKW